MESLEAVSPIDGRYRRKTKELSDYFSEKALISNRIRVEGEYLIALSEHPQTSLREFSEQEKEIVRKLYDVSLEDAQIVKHIEVKDHGDKSINDGKKTNHDVKSVEYYIKHRLGKTSLKDYVEWVHFALTSADTDNIAYGLMLRDALEDVIVPSLKSIYENFEEFAHEYAIVSMLARTHGQSASPTTTGKEFKVFASRLERQISQLENFGLLVKLNGATGNYNAHHAVYPDIDWLSFSEQFIESFNNKNKIKLEHNLITTQIEPHDTYAELFDNLSRANTILLDFDEDIWRYISDDWIKQKPKEGEVGSSTMPHKINPIDFENSEGNLGMANTLFSFFSGKLPKSRLQRDLSDSTVKRNFGVAFAHSLIGYKSLLGGLGKISVNEEKITEVLESHPEIISEAYQNILREKNITAPYELLKEMTRGKKVSIDDLRNFVDKLGIPDDVKKRLKEITPQNYTGLAKVICDL